jgi:hypothetical protein
MSEKVRENRARRAAARQGLVLTKSRRRDPRALDYGVYWVAQATAPGGGWRSEDVISPERGMTIDEVEKFLADGVERGPSDVS